MYQNYTVIQNDEVKKQVSTANNHLDNTFGAGLTDYSGSNDKRLEMARHINRKNRMKFMHLYQLEKHFR